ncbi:MAG: Asp-tRNA(Asn)/Glu-tRNA(Gln) amidotransferase subunit GatC [Alphaproteobacteria bacterium]
MSLTIDEIKRIAFLSRIKVNEEELNAMSEDLSAILAWIEQLQQVDVENVEPLASVVELTQPMRKDEITDGKQQEKVLANAPDAEDGYFTVPKVVE